MTEKDLINNLKQLKQVQPRKEWVDLVKQEILGEQDKISVFSFILRHKPAFASVGLFCFTIALVIASYQALPGDALFSVKKTTERVELRVKSDQNESLTVAQRRIDDLRRTQERAQKNIEPAITEVQSSVVRVTQTALQEPETKLSQQVINLDKEITSLGIMIENTEIEELYKREAESELTRLQELSLTLEQEELLEKVVELIEQEDYRQAFEIILEISS